MAKWGIGAGVRPVWLGGEAPGIETAGANERGCRGLSKEEKARIVAECCQPGASLEKFAHGHRVSPENARQWVRLAGRMDEVKEHGAAPPPAYVRLVLDEQVLAPPVEGWGRRGCRWAGHWGHGPGNALEALAEMDPDTSLRIVLATRPVDFRKLHDGLAAAVEHALGLDPYSGVVVVFHCDNRSPVGRECEVRRIGPSTPPTQSRA